MEDNYYKLMNSRNSKTNNKKKANHKTKHAKNTRNSRTTKYSKHARQTKNIKSERNFRNSQKQDKKIDSKRYQSNLRKRQAKKLNYKKVFIALALFILFIYLICLGISKITSNIFKKTSANTTSIEIPIQQQETSINMAIVGDIMCHSTNFESAYNKENDTYDFTNVFTEVCDYIKTADIAIGNLETTFSGKDIGYTGYPTFNTPEQLAQNLIDLGIDVVSTANNHSLDKRYAGLESTLNELDKVHLSHTGTYRSKEEQNTILTKDVNGIKFAFLSFTYGTNGIPVPDGKEYCINLIDENLILDQINKAKQLNPDVICVNMHWGEEYKLVQNSSQEKLADLLFKNGVDIILGSHPHVLQPMEKRTITLDDGTTKDGFVIYSLGNFMSGQVIENTRNSIILQLRLTKHTNNSITIDSYNYIPTYMYDSGAGQVNRYKILDINQTIFDHEQANHLITEDLYNTLKKAKSNIDKILNK